MSSLCVSNENTPPVPTSKSMDEAAVVLERMTRGERYEFPGLSVVVGVDPIFGGIYLLFPAVGKPVIIPR